MRLLIKNMVCRHCVEGLEKVFRQLDIPLLEAGLGFAETAEDIPQEKLEDLSRALAEDGLEIIFGREAETIERVKRLLIAESRREGGPSGSLPEILGKGFSIGYPTLSRMFSSVESRSIENYFMSLRIEYVKELIKYGRETLSEIAYRTGFSSVAHLSSRFKTFTGLTPSEFRKMGKRIPIPDV